MGDCDSSHSAPEAKRARRDGVLPSFPLVLDLAVPFLASGELLALANVNRICREAAISSYLVRLRTPFPILDGGSASGVAHRVEKMPRSSLHHFLPHNPWCHSYKLWKEFKPERKSKADDDEGDDEESYDENVDDEIEEMEEENPVYCNNFHSINDEQLVWKFGPKPRDPIAFLSPTMKLKEGFFHLPDGLKPAPLVYMSVIHRSWCPVDDTLLVIVARLESEAPSNDGIWAMLDVDIHREVWAVLYDLSRPCENESGVISEFRPTASKKLLGSKPHEGYRWDNHMFAAHNTVRSANGRMFAAVAEIPSEGVNEREALSEIIVFEITENDGFVQHSRIQILTRHHRSARSSLQLSLNNEGTALSVLHKELHDIDGEWLVYDLREKGKRHMFYAEDGCDDRVHYMFFTPDNEFAILGWLDPDEGENAVYKGLQQRLIEYGRPLFARRIVVPGNEDDDDDDTNSNSTEAS